MRSMKHPTRQQRLSNTPLHLGFLLAAIGVGGDVAAGEQAPADPLALLKGVEAVRLGVSSGRIAWTVTKRSFRSEEREREDILQVRVDFDGDRRRYDQYERILVIDGSGPDGGAAKNKLLDAMGGDRDAFVRAGHGRWE